MMNLSKALSLIILVALVVSCSKKKETNFTLKGSVTGLKKGIVYLQKDGDSSVIDLDSLVITGQSEFILKTNLDEPILLYLKLFKNDGEEHYIPFFADKGVTEIKTTLKSFNFNSEIKGSKQQVLLEEYLGVMSQFNNKNLDLIKADFMAQKENDSIARDSLSRTADQLIKRKYAYTIQFALNNKDSEIAPYLALYEAHNANPIYIDSIYNKLTSEIKASFYGKKLGETVTLRKSVE